MKTLKRAKAKAKANPDRQIEVNPMIKLKKAEADPNPLEEKAKASEINHQLASRSETIRKVVDLLVNLIEDDHLQAKAISRFADHG